MLKNMIGQMLAPQPGMQVPQPQVPMTMPQGMQPAGAAMNPMLMKKVMPQPGLPTRSRQEAQLNPSVGQMLSNFGGGGY